MFIPAINTVELSWETLDSSTEHQHHVTSVFRRSVCLEYKRESHLIREYIPERGRHLVEDKQTGLQRFVFFLFSLRCRLRYKNYSALLVFNLNIFWKDHLVAPGHLNVKVLFGIIFGETI